MICMKSIWFSLFVVFRALFDGADGPNSVVNCEIMIVTTWLLNGLQVAYSQYLTRTRPKNMTWDHQQKACIHRCATVFIIIGTLA